MPTLNRSAKSGKFVTAKKAKRNPNTTVRETVKKPIPKNSFVSNMLIVMIEPCKEGKNLVTIWTDAGGNKAKMNIPKELLSHKEVLDKFVLSLLKTLVLAS